MISVAFAVSALASIAVVQAGNPLIPDGISAGCSSYMKKLDADTTLAACTKVILDATSAFAPGSTSSGSPSDALAAICTSATPGCSASDVRSKLSAFYAACSDELTGDSVDSTVLAAYDALYTLTPMTAAVCTRDDSGNFCLTQSTPNTSTKRDVLDLSARAPSADSQDVIALNAPAFRSANLAFLYFSPSTPTSSLCVSCVRQVLSAYIAFETSLPYAPSLVKSPILGGQGDLYDAVNGQCGADFMNGGVQAVGGLSGGLGSVALGAAATNKVQGVIAALVALAVGAVAL